MKKIKVLTAVLAALVFAGCSNDIYEGEGVVNPDNGSAIAFGSFKSAVTRAGNEKTGKEAADLLGNAFVVSGYKGSATATVGTMVFDNYQVQYADNTAGTTPSNSRNWEYVGITPIAHATANGITQQTIKYWDYSQPQYDFIAWSTGTKTPIYSGTPAAGEVLVSAITPANATTAAYTFTGSAADLSNCYIADLVTVAKSDYQKPVTLRFRQLGTKVRIALYETIPGYSVKDVEFYSAAASDDASATAAKLFTTVANDIYTEGTYTVSYPTVDTPADADNNLAHVSFTGTGTQATTVSWGGLNYTIRESGEKSADKVYLGRTSKTASFAGNADDDYYVVFMPNESGTNLNLRVNYTLESIDGGGEPIVVKGATAQVPSIYTAWQPGYAYTYVFKISDKTNGHTGVYDPTKPDDTTVNSDPAGLWPITFDAIVVDAEDGDNTQETITLVSTPSITTYQKGSKVVNNDEYLASTGDIFVTVNDGETASTPDLANGKLQTLTGKAALYTIPAGKTEAEVIDALQLQDDDVTAGVAIKGRSGLELTAATSTLTNVVEFGVDGNPVSVGTDQAMRFTPAAGTYAFVYTKKAAVPANDEVKYEAQDWASFAAGQTKYRYDYKTATAGDAQKGVSYFELAGGVYTLVTPFIGQGVSNLYLDNAGNNVASGYAATGTTYYYTVDGGLTYQAATNISYAAFATTVLYKDATLTTPKTETTPVDGQAYYDASGKYCVILPQQTAGWYELDTTKYVVATETAAVAGQTYFDKYTKNDGVYYTKVIKVQ